MAQTKPLDKIMDVARTGFRVGKGVAGQVGKAAVVRGTKAAGAVSGYVAQRRQAGASPAAPTTTPAPAKSTPTPPPAAPAEDTTAAVTSDVDAAPAEAEPTPADVAKVVARKPRPKAPATKQTRKPVKKSVPGAKLPPRKPVEEVAPAKDSDKG